MIPISHPKRQFKQLEVEILTEIQNVLQSGSYILGEQVTLFEQEVAKKLGVTDAIGVGNGTDALVITLEAFNIKEGDEVITTPFTFFATAEAIERVGAIPVFVDIDDETYTINPQKIEEKITKNTKAIIPVHLFGQPAHMTEINEIANRYNLIVIEDACQAFGATYRGKPVGQLSDAACFSFFPTKNLSTLGDGGLITTSNKEIADKIRKLRVHGSSRKYYHDCIGYNSRLDEIHAAVLRVCLQYIDEWNELRQAIASRYNEHLKDHIHSIQLPEAKVDRTHVYHLYCITTPHRGKMMSYLQRNGIQTGVYYPQCLHLQKAFHHLKYQIGDLPIAEQKAKQLLAIPIFPYLTDEEQTHIIQVLRQFVVNET